MHKICFTISLLHASTCFEHHVLIVRRSKLYYTASGVITPIGGRPVHGTASSWLITKINILRCTVSKTSKNVFEYIYRCLFFLIMAKSAWLFPRASSFDNIAVTFYTKWRTDNVKQWIQWSANRSLLKSRVILILLTLLKPNMITKLPCNPPVRDMGLNYNTTFVIKSNILLSNYNISHPVMNNVPIYGTLTRKKKSLNTHFVFFCLLHSPDDVSLIRLQQ